MAIGDGLLYGLILVVAYLGLIILTGFIIAIINTLFYRITGAKSHKICLATGFIGTPIHELGHAFFCLVFGHKIVEIKLFQTDSRDGTLGYVSHSYNKKNLYHRIGNFFIGVGPIIFGSGLILLLLFMLNNSGFKLVGSVMNFFTTGVPASASMYPNWIIGGLSIFVENFFVVENFNSVSWWIFIILGVFISLHMRLSKPDINGAFDGFFFSALILFIVPVVISIFSFEALSRFMGIMLSGAACMFCVYTLSIILALVSLVFALLIKLITKLFNK